MSKKDQQAFKRREVKYLLTEQQVNGLFQVFPQYMVRDEFFKSTISNLYYDTPSFQLIRQSLEKPPYKEKLRLRCYSVPKGDTKAFVELKKKFAGTVYKRRVSMPYGQALSYLSGKGPGGESQIFKELDWALQFYKEVEPAMFISYRRYSFQGKDNPDLRITFDSDLLWRRDHLDLAEGTWGEGLLPPGQCLMEIKIPGAMPIWLAQTLSQLQIFPNSFSKYGKAYQTWMGRRFITEEVRRYA